MTDQRLVKLKELKTQLPDDPFVDYAMALEYVKQNNAELATRAFKYLQEHHSSYLPQYYHYGALLINLDKTAEAKLVINAGVKLAKEQQDEHTVSELISLLDVIEDL